ncbi:MAG: hypothetical protein M3R17_20080 [Bacteroidota bacterium]|nr:hypothetical protein [Bacteroidota bacterium]
MESKQTKDFVKFLKANIDPFDDPANGPGYRTSVYLTDGTFLPCVIFRNPKTIINLAIKRFKEEQSRQSVFKRSSGLGYYDIVRSFVTTGNSINDYDIERIEKSRFAFPLSIQRQIKGETTMGYTGFSAKMKDGTFLGFGTSFHTEFFQIPDNYSPDDVEEIINHSFVLKSGELRSHRQAEQTRPGEYKDAIVYREKPFFECYIDSL